MTINFWAFWLQDDDILVDRMVGVGRLDIDGSAVTVTNFEVVTPVEEINFPIDKVRMASYTRSTMPMVALGNGDTLCIFESGKPFKEEEALYVAGITAKAFDISSMDYCRAVSGYSFYGVMTVFAQPDQSVKVATWRTVYSGGYLSGAKKQLQEKLLPASHSASAVSLGNFGADVYGVSSNLTIPDLYNHETHTAASYEVYVQPEPQNEVLEPAWNLVRRPVGYFKYIWACATYKRETYRPATWIKQVWYDALYKEQSWVAPTAYAETLTGTYSIYFVKATTDVSVATAYGASIYIDPYSADKTCTTYMFRRELVSVTKYSTNYWKLTYRQYTVNTCAKDGYWTNTGTTGRFATQPAETATTRWVLSSLGYWSTTTETMVTDTQPADGAGYKWTLSLASGWDYVETITSCATPVSTSTVRYTLSAAGKWVYSGVVYADAAPASTSAIKYVATTAAVWLVDTGGYDASWTRQLVQDAHWAVETSMNTARALATRVNTPPAGWRLPKTSAELQTLPSREIVSPFWSRWEGATLTAQPDGTEGTDWRRTLRLQGFTMPVYALVNAGAMMMSIDQGSYVIRYDESKGTLKTDELMKPIALAATFINNGADLVDTALADGGWYTVLATDDYVFDFDGGFYPIGETTYSHELDGEDYEGLADAEINGGFYPVAENDVYGAEQDGNLYPQTISAYEYEPDGERY